MAEENTIPVLTDGSILKEWLETINLILTKENKYPEIVEDSTSEKYLKENGTFTEMQTEDYVTIFQNAMN